MSSKQEAALYPSVDNFPNAPPQYDAGQPPSYGQPTAQQPQVVIMQPQQQQVPLGPQPTRVTCPSCHATNVSRCEFKSSSKTHLIAVILCATTCCCCIPYCIDSCKNVDHHCSQCGAYLGTFSR